MDEAVEILELMTADPLLCQDEAWRESARSSVADTLSQLVHGASLAGHRLPRPSTRANIVSKAIEFMEAHVSDHLSMPRICSAVRVSSRTLQYSFEEILGVSPRQFLTVLRLRKVRRELLAGDCAHRVHRIAQRYGFGHMGRFARYYQEAFSESPSDTCRRVAS